MLFSEFQANTNCKDNEYNHQVYRELEIIYMETGCTKEHIYEMGRKLVDNSKTEEQLRIEEECKERIVNAQIKIAECKEWMEYYKSFGNDNMVKYYRQEIKRLRNEIKEQKWVMGA